MRQWKIALSLAIVGATAAPFALHTYKMRPTTKVFIPLTAEQQKLFEAYLKENCPPSYSQPHSQRQLSQGEINKIVDCSSRDENLRRGGDYQNRPNDLLFFFVNFGVAIIAFASVFALVFLLPALARRYWKWLNA